MHLLILSDLMGEAVVLLRAFYEKESKACARMNMRRAAMMIILHVPFHASEELQWDKDGGRPLGWLLRVTSLSYYSWHR